MSARAYLMAAGLGTRLYPLTGLTSKPMVPILNRPVMEHLLRLLRRHGVTEIAANLHYHPDKIRSYFGDGSEFGVEVRYNLEERLLGTAGGADAFREFLSGSTFLVMSGDGLTDIDLTAFLAAHKASGRDRHDGGQGGRRPLAVRGGRPRRRHARGRLSGEAAAGGGALHALQLRHLRLRAGDLRLRRARRLRGLGQGRLPGAAGRRASRSTAGSSTTYWNDVGNIEQYRLSNFDALLGRVDLEVPGRQISPRVWVGQGTEIEPGVRLEAPILLGAGCLIEAGAELIGPLIIGDGCVVERGAVLEGVIQWDGAKAGRGSRLAGSILGRNVVVHHEAVVHEDAVIGDRSSVAAHALIEAGARLEPRTRIGPGGPGVDVEKA